MPTLIPVRANDTSQSTTSSTIKQGLVPIRADSIKTSDPFAETFGANNAIEQIKQQADQEKQIQNFQPSYFNGLNDDEEKIVNEMQVRGAWSKEEADYAKQVMTGNTPEYKQRVKDDQESSAFGFFTGPVYYFDPSNKGLPKMLKPGEKVPNNASLESFWGANKLAFEAAAGTKLHSKVDAENDNFLTTSVKQVVNTFMDIIKVPTQLIGAVESSITNEKSVLEDDNQKISNMLDQLHMATSSASKERATTDKLKDFSDYFNSDSYHITSQNLASFLGQAVGSLLQFGAVGKLFAGATKVIAGIEAMTDAEILSAKNIIKSATASEEEKLIAETALSKSKLTRPQILGSGYAAGVMVNLGQTIDDARKGKVTPREAALMGIGNAMVYSAIEQIGGGPEARFLRGMEEGGAMKKMNQTLLKTIKDNGGVINPEVLKKAFLSTLETGIKEIPKAKQIGMDILKEAGEETLQEMESRGSEQLFNSLAGYNAYQGTFGDSEHLRGYFENALGGALGGAFGGAFTVATGHKEYDETDAHIYDYVRAGKTTELKQELMNMQAGKKISTDDVKAYSTLIDTYSKYYEQLSNKNLPREDGAKVFENAFNIEHLHGQVAELEKNPTISPIQKGEVDVLRTKANEYQKEINSVLKGEKTFVEKNEETTLEPEQDATPTPIDVHTIEANKWGKMKPSEKKNSFVNHLKTQETPITGTVEKKSGSTTAYSFAEPNGKNVTFYNHADHDKITEEDLQQPAQLILTPETTNEKGEKFKDVVQVKIGDKIVGNVQETDFEKSVKSASKSEMRENPVHTQEEEYTPETFSATSEEKNLEKGIRTGVELSKNAKQKLGKLGFTSEHLDVMSPEDVATAKTFASKEDASEMVDKYSKVVAKEKGEELNFSPKEKSIIEAHKQTDEHIKKAQANYDKAQGERETYIKENGYPEGHDTEFDKLVTAKVDAEDRLNQLKKAKENLLPLPNKKTEEKPTVTVKELKQRIPKSRKIIRELIRDPESLDEAITQLLLTTRIKTSDFVRFTGFGVKNGRGKIVRGKQEFNEMRWARHEKGTPLDMFVEIIPEQFTEGLGVMDLENKIMEVLFDNPSKRKLIKRLQFLQKEQVQEIDEADMEKYREDEKAFNELKGVDVGESEATPEVIADKWDGISDKDKGKIISFITEFTNEDGVTDWDAVDKAMDSDRIFELPKETTDVIHSLIQEENDRARKENQGQGISDTTGGEEENPPTIEGEEIKYQSPSIIKEIEGKLTEAKNKLESAKKKVISKRTELLKTKLADSEDLFGEKKSEQEQQLFYEKTEGDIEKILEPQKSDVAKAETEVEKLKKQLEDAKNDTSQTEMKFQGKEEETLATDNPKLNKFIRTRLKKLFPNVQVFDDAKLFQEFLDKNYPGKKLDLTKLGASIGDAIYINPDSAVQSTAIHEHAHLYWDMMPSDSIVKENLLKLFKGDEEATITAIGQAGVDIAKVELEGGKLARFKSLLKTFWAKVKSTLGIATKADLTRIMADAVWTNAHKIESDNEAEGNGVLKFMSDNARAVQEKVIRQLQSFADFLDFNEKDHTYFNKQGDIEFASVTGVLDLDSKYKFEGGMNAEDARTRGKAIDGIIEALINGTDPLESLAKHGVTMDESVVNSLAEQLTPFIEKLKSEGEVLPQAMIANNTYKVAGTSDIIVVKKDGTIDIYDVKASKTPTSREGYSKATISKGKEKASKKDLHGVQMAMYGALLESPDMLFGQTGKTIGKLVVVPIHLEATGKNITEVKLEPLIESDYQQYKDEAERILDKQLAKTIDADEVLNVEMEALTQKEYFNKSQVFIGDEKMSIAQALKRSENKAEDKIKYLEQYKRYTEQLQNATQITYNIETATEEQLFEAYNLIYSYDNLVQNKFLDDLANKMRDRLIEEQRKRTGVKDESERPFTFTEVYFTLPSKVTEEHPFIQAVVRKKLLTDEDNFEDTDAIKKEFKKVWDALKKEKRKIESIGQKVLRGLSSSLEDKSKYFKNLVKKDTGGKLRLKNYRNSADAKTLSPVEFAYLKHYTDVIEKMYKDVNAQEQITDGFFPQLNPTFFENAYNTGFMKAVSDHFYNDRVEDVILKYKNDNDVDEFMRYEDVVDKINDDESLSKAVKIVRLRNMRNRADSALANRRGEDGKKIVKQESGYRLTANGKLAPKSLKEKEGVVSLDLNRAFTAYVEDMNNVKYMNKVMPYAKSLLDYYRKKGDDHEFTKKFVEAFVLGDIQGTKIEKTTPFTKAIRFAQMWTYLNVMTFNAPVAMWNTLQGVSQLIKHELWITGSKRFFGDWRKSMAIGAKYHIVSIDTSSTIKSGAGLFTYLANGLTTMAESYLQTAGFIAQMSQEQFDNFNIDGSVKDENLLPSKEEIQKMKLVKNNILLVYNEGDKRMYKHWALASAAMQFKGWIPGFIEDRLEKSKIDIFGSKKKGSWQSLKYATNHLGMLFSDPKTLFTSQDVDMKNNRGHLKNAIFIALVISLAGGAADDDKDRALSMRLWKAVNNMTGAFNLNTLDFILTQPMPFLGTLHNFKQALTAIPDHYDKATTYGEKGDWMFPSKIMNVLPYGHLGKHFFVNPNYH